MARPQVNNCSYFPHSSDLRNDRRVKALFAKFEHVGFSVFIFLLENLTGSDYNKIHFTELELELLAGDMRVEVEMLKRIIDYCIEINLLQIDDQFLHSAELDHNLQPVFDKRQKAKEISQKQKRVNGQFATDKNGATAVSVTETPQSKVEYSKVNKSIVNKRKEKQIQAPPVINISFEIFWNLYDKKVGDRAKLEKKWNKLTDEEREKIMSHVPQYKLQTPDKQFRKNPETYLNNKSFNDEVIPTNNNQIIQQNGNNNIKHSIATNAASRNETALLGFIGN